LGKLYDGCETKHQPKELPSIRGLGDGRNHG
jgi:hypothetical protein